MAVTSEVNQKWMWHCHYVEEAKSRGKTLCSLFFLVQTRLSDKICEEKQSKFENIVLKKKCPIFGEKLDKDTPKTCYN